MKLVSKVLKMNFISPSEFHRFGSTFRHSKGYTCVRATNIIRINFPVHMYPFLERHYPLNHNYQPKYV
jgi:hypothetical protein